MAFPIAWAVGSFIGGLLAKEFYDDVIADNYEDDEEEKEKDDYNDEVIAALFEKLVKDNDAKGLYDFGCILEAMDKEWARTFIKTAANMDFMLAQQKLRCMDEKD